MPQVYVRADKLDEANAAYEQARLERPIFLNSVPKSGSHLLRNILRMFVPVDQHYTKDFIQWGNMQSHLAAFDPKSPKLSWGHLFFADASVIETAACHRVVLYRDPYDWVLARARFMLSEQFSGNVDHLREKAMSTDELLTSMIFGLPRKLPSLNDIYELNAAAWLGSRCHVVKFEDLSSAVKNPDAPETEAFFGRLFEACGLARPDDWKDRVKIGSDRKQSATARENLTGVETDFPETLGAQHRALVDYHAPGLRAVLGYE